MSRAVHHSGGHDGNRIDINDPSDVEYWTQAFAVDEATLREAVAQVGMLLEDVRQHLDGVRSPKRRPARPARPSR